MADIEITGFAEDDYRGAGSVAYLQIVSEQDWWDEGGDHHAVNSYEEVELEVNTSTHRIDETSFFLTPTQNATVNQRATYRFQIVDANRRNPVILLQGVSVPYSTPVLSWGSLALYATAQQPWRDVSTFTKTETLALVQQQIGAVLTPDADADTKGFTALSIDPVPSTSPKAWAYNDPLVRDAVKIQGRTVSTDRPVDGRGYVYDQASDSYVPGRPSEAPTLLTIIRDTFDAADGTSNHGRRPSHTNLPGATYRSLKGDWVIRDGLLQPESTDYPDGAKCVINTGTSDFTFSVVATCFYDGSDLTTRSKSATIFRIEDERNHLAFLNDPGSGVAGLYDVTNGVETLLTSSANALPSEVPGHLTVITSGPDITIHVAGQEPVLYTTTAHMNARDVGVAAYKGVGTPGQVPTYFDLVVSPTLKRVGTSPVMTSDPGTWHSNDMCAPTKPEWDEDAGCYVSFPSGYNGTDWVVGEAYSDGRNYKSWTVEPDPVITPTADEHHFIAGLSRPVYHDGLWYAVAYRAGPGTDPSTGTFVFPFRVIGFTSPTLRHATWTRINNGNPIVSLSGPADGGAHDIDLILQDDGVWQILLAARSADGTRSVIAHCTGDSLLTMGPVTQLNVMGIYGVDGATDLGQPTRDGKDPLVYSVTSQRTTLFGGQVRRYLIRSDTFDGGVTWKHNSLIFAKGVESFESVQAGDYSGLTLDGDVYFGLVCGMANPGGDQNLFEGIRVIEARLPTESLAMPSDPTPGIVTLTDGATITIDMSENGVFQGVVTINGNRALVVEKAVSGDRIYLVVIQGAGGSHSLTVPAGSVVSGGGVGLLGLSTVAGRRDLVEGLVVGSVLYWRVTQNFS